MKMYLQSTTKPDVRFEILSYNPETKMMHMRGATGFEFDEKVDTAMIAKFNYRIDKVEDAPAQVTA